MFSIFYNEYAPFSQHLPIRYYTGARDERQIKSNPCLREATNQVVEERYIQTTWLSTAIINVCGK